MLISNVHKSIIVMNSLDTRFSKNVFEAVEKTRSTCFLGSKTTRLRLVVLNPIKHSCSFFKHCLKTHEIISLTLQKGQLSQTKVTRQKQISSHGLCIVFQESETKAVCSNIFKAFSVLRESHRQNCFTRTGDR